MPEALRHVERRLAGALIDARPGAAAAALEEAEPADAARILADAGPASAARVVSRMLPAEAAEVIERLDDEAARGILAELPPRTVAGLLRRHEEGPRERLLQLLDEETREAARRILAVPDGTAGALMDPRILALPADLEVRAARARVLERPGETHYNVYVVERDGELVGVLNLRELLTLPEQETLRSVMNPVTWRIEAGVERLSVVSHPGWRHVHSLPVVDEGGRFLGAIRYRTLRELEEETFRRLAADAPSTGQALGDLYWTGIAGLLSAVVSALEPDRRDGILERGPDGA